MIAPSDRKPNHRLLYVEDTDEIRATWTDRLRGMGYEVTVVENEKEAFETFDANPELFDIAFADLGLPPMFNAEAIGSDDPQVGARLLAHFRSVRPDMALVAYSLLPVADFTPKVIADLVTCRASFAAFRVRVVEEDIRMILTLAERGFVVYSPGIAPLLSKQVLRPENTNPLEPWEFRILTLRRSGKTLQEIADATRVPFDTIRSDFDDIYRKLENGGLMSRLNGERRDPQWLNKACDELLRSHGPADGMAQRPSRKPHVRP